METFGGTVVRDEAIAATVTSIATTPFLADRWNVIPFLGRSDGPMIFEVETINVHQVGRGNPFSGVKFQSNLQVFHTDGPMHVESDIQKQE